MGGDKAPRAVVTGAYLVARQSPEMDIILVGDEAVIQPLLQEAGGPLPNLRTHHASQVVGMCDAPGVAFRQKPDSSIAVGMRLVRDKQAHAFTSAGNSGAMMASAMLVLRPQPGIDRPAIATPLPARTGLTMLLDAGATTDCKPQHLLQFAHLGSTYVASVMQRPNPRVGLLSIGEEPTKGDELTKETHKLLLTSGLNFIGNIEPKELMHGEADVAVCDGFVGNLMLKAGEAFGDLIMEMIKSEIQRRWYYQLAALLLRPAFHRVKKVFDYAEYGGALLLGVNGVVLIGHGRSNALAIQNAIRTAALAATRGIAVPAGIPEQRRTTGPATS